MLKLHFKDKRQAPLWLTEERFTIGQAANNQLVLADSGISASHAEILREQGHYFISDCASQGGTFVNAERISGRFQLRSGDAIRLGSVELGVTDPAKTEVRQEGQANRWFLLVLKGEREGHKFLMTASQTFGRSAQCELSFAGDQELSRRHCEFYLKDEALHVKDLGSANGVRVNQQKVSITALAPGDQVQMGSVSLLVIGPKVEVQQSAVDEDATLFMPALKLPKAAAQRQVSQAAVANPARAQAVPAVPSEVETSLDYQRVLLLGVALLVVLGGGAWLLL